MTSSTIADAPRSSRLPVIVGIAVIGLAIIATLLLLAVLDPGEEPAVGASGEPSPPATASASATELPASASGEPTAVPSPTSLPPTGTPVPSGDQAAEVGLPPGLLPPGSVVIATGDGLRIRAEPTTGAGVLATVAAGDALYVLDSTAAGPVTAQGYDWYQVEYADGADVWPWQDVSPATARGWVAAGSATERFVRLAPIACPSEPVTLEMLAFDITPWGRLVCFGGGSIEVQGTYGCDGCAHPPIAGQYRYYPYVVVALAPDMTPPDDRDIIRANLSVDDPAATSCTHVPYPGEQPVPSPEPAAVEVYCRERLVLESFEVVGYDDFGLPSP